MALGIGGIGESGNRGIGESGNREIANTIGARDPPPAPRLPRPGCATSRPAPCARDFYARRAQRILPAYYVHLLVLFFLLVPLLRGLEFWRYNPTYMAENLHQGFVELRFVRFEQLRNGWIGFSVFEGSLEHQD